jgi:DNA-binding MarR family transcriptional regulator
MAIGRSDGVEDVLVAEAVSDLETLVGYNLKRAYIVMHDDFQKALSEERLAPRVFAALSLVVQYPRETQSELARRLGIERSGLVALVDDLERRGLLRRATVTGDRRLQALVATDEGIRVQARAHSKVEAHERALLSGFTEPEKRRLLEMLRRIRAAAASA